jgi:hypothetical protein
MSKQTGGKNGHSHKIIKLEGKGKLKIKRKTEEFK